MFQPKKGHWEFYIAIFSNMTRQIARCRIARYVILNNITSVAFELRTKNA